MPLSVCHSHPIPCSSPSSKAEWADLLGLAAEGAACTQDIKGHGNIVHQDCVHANAPPCDMGLHEPHPSEKRPTRAMHVPCIDANRTPILDVADSSMQVG